MTLTTQCLWVATMMAEGDDHELGGCVLGPCDAGTAMHEVLRLRPPGWAGHIELVPMATSPLKPWEPT